MEGPSRSSSATRSWPSSVRRRRVRIPERARRGAVDAAPAGRELFGHQLALRIGVNTGEVVVGRPREGSSFVTGDAVNVAARLEQAARPGQILAGERTAVAVGAAFEFSAASRSRRRANRAASCAGRSFAWSRRRDRAAPGGSTLPSSGANASWRGWRQLAACRNERRPRFASLVGEASRPRRASSASFGRECLRVLFRLGRCVSYGRSVTYSPLADVLRAELGLFSPVETALARLAGREILGLTLGFDVGGDLDPRAAAERLRREWVRLVTELAATQTVVLVVERPALGGEPLRELLERLLEDVEGPLLLLVTARPDRPELRVAGESSSLEPLTAEEAERVLHRLLGSEVQQLDRRPFSSGRPTATRSSSRLLSTLIGRGPAHARGRLLDVARYPATLDVPDSVQALWRRASICCRQPTSSRSRRRR